MKKNKGITLVALVITIIILLILAGITISQLTGSGLFENARLAEEKYKEAEIQEQAELAIQEAIMKMYSETEKTSIIEYIQSTENKSITLSNGGKIYYNNETYYYENNNGKIIELEVSNEDLRVSSNIKDKETIDMNEIIREMETTTGAQKYIGKTVSNYKAEGLSWQIYDITEDGNILLTSKENVNTELKTLQAFTNTSSYAECMTFLTSSYWEKYMDTSLGAISAAVGPSIEQYNASARKTGGFTDGRTSNCVVNNSAPPVYNYDNIYYYEEDGGTWLLDDGNGWQHAYIWTTGQLYENNWNGAEYGEKYIRPLVIISSDFGIIENDDGTFNVLKK